MRVDGRFSLEKLDDRNFAIIEHKIKGKDSSNEGEEYKSTFGYYGTLQSAVERLLNLGINTESLDTILKSIENAKNEILKEKEWTQLI